MGRNISIANIELTGSISPDEVQRNGLRRPIPRRPGLRGPKSENDRQGAEGDTRRYHSQDQNSGSDPRTIRHIAHPIPWSSPLMSLTELVAVGRTSVKLALTLKSIGAGIDKCPVRYKGSIGSQTARFARKRDAATEAGDPDGMNYIQTMATKRYQPHPFDELATTLAP